MEKINGKQPAQRIEFNPLVKSQVHTVTVYSDGVNGEIKEIKHLFNPLMQTKYLGVTVATVPGLGQMQVQFPLDATNLEQAIDDWAVKVEDAVLNAVEQAKSQAFRQQMLAQPPANSHKV